MPRLVYVEANVLTSLGNREFVVGRNPQADLVLRDPSVSRSHFRIVHCDGAHWLEPMTDKLTLVNDKPVESSVRLDHGARIIAGRTELIYEDDLQATQLATRPPERMAVSPTHIPVNMSVVAGRDRQSCGLCLAHAQVSRQHAQIFRTTNEASIRDLGSANGTFVNGKRIDGDMLLSQGDEIQIGPFEFVFDGEFLEPLRGGRTSVELRCIGLTRSLPNSGLDLIRDINLTIRPGQFCCLMGPTGAGKSTLLRALSKRETLGPDTSASGSVFVNSHNLYEEFEALKHQLAVVPQQEILYDQLPLRQTLEYTARLRLPVDFSTMEIEERIDQTLELVQLTDSSATRIAGLSGGQRKRAALANEILSQPSLLFLDEVTSGLDELTDGEMMSLFRKLSHEGRTVVCVTHSLAFVPECCDLVVALTRFGRLAFVGHPRDALEFFGVAKLPDIYQQLFVATSPAADEVHQTFLDSPYAADYRSELEQTTRTTSALPSISQSQFRFSSLVRQLFVLTRRYMNLVLTDRRANIVRLIQFLVVGVLLCSVFGSVEGDPGSQLKCAFLLVVSAFWFGCNNAAKEIVKERAIYQQERNVALSVPAYLISKIAVLACIASAQATLLFLMVVWWTHLPGEIWQWMLLVSATAITGMAVGLVVSGYSSSEEVAIGTIPVVLIPQIILAGSIMPLDGWNQIIASVAVPTFWSYEAATAILKESQSFSWSLAKAVMILGVQALLAVVIVLGKLEWEKRER